MKKILFIGPEVTDFLNPLASKLKDLGYTADLLENRKVARNTIAINKSYSNVLNYNELSTKKITVARRIKYLFALEFYKNLLTTIFINYLEGECKVFKSIRNSLARQNSNEIFSSTLNKYDIINIHSLTPNTISFINYINQDKKIILTFWGSDLYQTSGIKNYDAQFKAMKRADIITVLNYEMEKVVLAKFGSELKNKIFHTALGIDDEIFNLMDDNKKVRPDLNYMTKYNIPENKIKITVSYSGNPVCNHLLILHELEKMDNKIKENIHLLVPMTYGNISPEYMEEVIMALDRTNISYTLFDKFLSLNELAKLRVNSDVMIQMNKSDGFNTSVREALYADNILISAVWLPYSLLRLENIFFYETDFTKLTSSLSFVINNYEKIKNNVTTNPIKAKMLTAFSYNFQPWKRVFESLCLIFNLFLEINMKIFAVENMIV